MKKITKFLSVLAVAGSLGLNTINVKADDAIDDMLSEVEKNVARTTCEASGGKVHTNYYLFLNVNSKEFYENRALDFYDSVYPKAKESVTPGYDDLNKIVGREYYYVTHRNQVVNNIKDFKIIDRGPIEIIKDGESTDNKWNAEHFWQVYYVIGKNGENLSYSSVAGENDYLDNPNKSYFLHQNWWQVCEGSSNTDKECTEEQRKTTVNESLLTYLSNPQNITKLVNEGTATPKTTFNNNIIGLSEQAGYLNFTVRRGFTEVDPTSNDKDTGALNYGTTLGGALSKESVYSPAAYKIEYCVTADKNTPDDQNPSNPTGSYTVTYNANGGKDAPASQSGKTGECVKISDKKPVQTGHTFLGWSTNKDAVEPDKNFAAGEEYCGKNGDITLYAVWRDETGINSHVVAFGTLAAGSIIALIVAKKKNLFKQI